MDYLSKASLSFFETYLVIERLPDTENPRLVRRLTEFARNPRKLLREWFSVRERVSVLDAAVERAAKHLCYETNNFLKQCEGSFSAESWKRRMPFAFCDDSSIRARKRQRPFRC